MADAQDNANAPATGADAAAAATAAQAVAAAAATQVEEQRRLEEEPPVDTERRRPQILPTDFGPEGMPVPLLSHSLFDLLHSRYDRKQEGVWVQLS